MAFVDQTRDVNGQHLYRLLNTVSSDGTKLFSPPDFVKTASADRIVGNAELAPGVFGNPRDRLFPCHTGPATWVSAVFFHTQKQAMDRRTAQIISDRIDAAARYHGITSFVEAVKEAVAKDAARKESDLPDEDFALVIQYEDGQKERYLPIRNANEVKAACDYLRQHSADFTFDDRRVIAEKILTKAAQYSVDLGGEREALEKQAGHGTCAPETAAELVYSRAKAVRQLHGDLEMAENLTKMAMQCLKNPSYTALPSNLHKIAGLIDRVDREYGFKNLSTLRKPEEALFQINIKVAEQVLNDHVSMTSGNIYSKKDLAGLKLEDIRAVMGDRFADAVSNDGLFLDVEKLAEVARTLPRGDAELFDSLLSQMKVKPVYKEAAHHASGPLASADALLQLASLHTS